MVDTPHPRRNVAYEEVARVRMEHARGKTRTDRSEGDLNQRLISLARVSRDEPNGSKIY